MGEKVPASGSLCPDGMSDPGEGRQQETWPQTCPPHPPVPPSATAAMGTEVGGVSWLLRREVLDGQG